MSDTIKHLVFNEQGLIGMDRNCQMCQRWPLRIHTKFELKACFKCLTFHVPFKCNASEPKQ